MVWTFSKNLTVEINDWSFPFVMNQVPAASGRTYDDGARMASGLLFDADGTLVTFMYRRWSTGVSSNTKFSRILTKLQADLSSAVGVDVYAHAEATNAGGNDPRYIDTGEWMPTVSMANGASTYYMLIDNYGTDVASPVYYWRKRYSWDEGAGWETDDDDLTYDQYSPAGPFEYDDGGTADLLIPTTDGATGFFALYGSGFADTSVSNGQARTVYNDGLDDDTYVINWFDSARTRAGRSLGVASVADGGNWEIQTVFPSGAGTVSQLNIFDPIISGVAYTNVEHINACIAYWEDTTNVTDADDDIIVVAYLDNNMACRIGRFDCNQWGGFDGETDLSGALPAAPEDSNRPTVFDATGMGINGMRMCSDQTTQQRIFLVTQVLNGDMWMFYSDTVGLTWDGPNKVNGAAAIFTFADGSKDNQSRFFINAFTPDELFVMALTDNTPLTGGKPEWAILKWTDPNA